MNVPKSYDYPIFILVLIAVFFAVLSFTNAANAAPVIAPEMVQKLVDLTVAIGVPTTCSGVKYIGEDGNHYVITAGHCFRGETQCTIRAQHRVGDRIVGFSNIQATVVATHESLDFALLRIAKPIWHYSAELRSDVPRTGERACHVGIIGSRLCQISVTPGMVSMIRRRTPYGEDCEETTCPAWNGSSGGGVYDEDGRLLGLILGPAGGAPTLNRIVPVRLFRDWLASHTGADPI